MKKTRGIKRRTLMTSAPSGGKTTPTLIAIAKRFIPVLLLLALAGSGWAMSNDTCLVRYGVSTEPMTAVDTVTIKHQRRENGMFYLLPLAGGEIWAAWIQPIQKEGLK